MHSPPAAVERAVETTVDAPVREWHRLDGGRIAETYQVEFATGRDRAVCKIGGPSVRTGEVVEPLVVDLVSTETALPVPAVEASGTVSADEPTEWALYEYRDGAVPTPYPDIEPAVRTHVVRQIGDVLARLHEQLQFERTGGLARRNGSLCIEEPEGLNFPERGRDLAGLHPSLDGEAWQPVLSHGDLFHGNLLIDDVGEITAVLDWGNAHVSTPGYTLGRAEMRFIDWFQFSGAEEDRLRTALRDGYRDHRSLPPDYPALASYYKALWLAQSADRVLRHVRSPRGRRQLKRHVRSLIAD